jgi:eukaryotic-like serine/threonine-protein kinase
MLYRFGELTLDEERFELRARGELVEVQRLVLETLLYLIKNQHRIVPKEELVESLWRGTAITDASLTQAVFLARKAIGDSANSQRFIKTVRGVGFRFIGGAEDAGSSRRTTRLQTPGSDLALAAVFVGRNHELEQLRLAFERARHGDGGLVLVGGEPGVGKTALCTHWAQSLLAEGAVVAWGRGWEGGGAPAFWPWVQLLRRLLSGRNLDVHPELQRAARGVAELFPELGELSNDGTPLDVSVEEPVPQAPNGAALAWTRSNTSARPRARPAESASERFVRFEATCALLERLSADRPLVLVLEDLHCFDELSSLVVQFLSREVVRLPVLMVGTYRSTETPPAGGASLGERVHLRLRGLDSHEVRSFVEKHTGTVTSPALLAALHELTAGNPLLLEEALRSLRTHGPDALRSKGDRTSDLLLPERAARAIRAGLLPLPSATRELLGVAAVIGRSFDLPLLRRVADLSSQESLGRLAPAVASGFVREVGLGRYTFSHAMVQETLYADLGIDQRPRWHQRVGEAIETLSAALASHAQLGHHFLQAARIIGPAKAVHYQALAAREARARLAYEDAVVHYERAIEVVGLIGDRAAAMADTRAIRLAPLLLALAEVQRASGRYAPAIATFTRAAAAARGAGDVESLARAAVGYGETQTQVIDLELNELLREALASLPVEDSILRARLLGRLAVGLNFVPHAETEREAMSREALEMARRLGDETAIAYTLNSRRWCMSAELDVRELMAISEEAVERATAIGNASLANESRIWKIADHLQLEDVPSLTRELEVFAATAERLREPWHRMVNLRFKAMWALLRGELLSGERLIEEAFAAANAAADTLAEIVRASQRVTLYRDTSRSEMHLDVVLTVSQILPTEYSTVAVSALICAETGRREQAQAFLDMLSKDDFAIIPPYLNGMTALVWAADAAHRLDDRAAAKALYRRLEPHARRSVIGGGALLCLGPVTYRLGLLAETMDRLDDALIHFEDAAARCRRLGALPLLAWSLFACARVSRARAIRDGTDGRVRERISEARELGERIGMLFFLDELTAFERAN